MGMKIAQFIVIAFSPAVILFVMEVLRRRKIKKIVMYQNNIRRSRNNEEH